jgi:plasmid stability protein
MGSAAIISVVKQIITRVDLELASALKRQAARTGESVNAYVNRLLRVAVVGPDSPRHMWKAAAVADGRLMPRGMRTGRPRSWAMDFKTAVNPRAGYAAEMVSTGRKER